MKNIKNYDAKKYKQNGFQKIEEGIYKKQGIGGIEYVTSLSFTQEPEYGEGNDSTDISQYPLEDILDEFSCYVSDFYDEVNQKQTKECCLEFAAENMEHIKKLRNIIGKHVYTNERQSGEKSVVELVID